MTTKAKRRRKLKRHLINTSTRMGARWEERFAAVGVSAQA